MTRRVLLARAGKVALTLGTSSVFSAPADPYSTGLWIAGDHHIHTRFSSDGRYLIAEQVANAARHGLGWCVITDHGSANHDKVAMEAAYPELVAARRANPNLVVFQGLEWNIPSGEHASVILPPTADEAQRIAEFEALFDEKNISRENTPADTEASAVAGLRYLQKLTPKPLVFANHPARQGFDSPHEFRAWRDAGPDVMRGFEGSPGHHASVFNGIRRGWYNLNKQPQSWPGYPPESYRTWGGYDWYVAKVGGLWDSLLGEGRPWFITTNSDSHRHFKDVPAAGTNLNNNDFHPGEYNKTWVHVRRASPEAILDGLRSGNMFTTLGNLVSGVELTARADQQVVGMGSTLLAKRNQDVTMRLRVRVPFRPIGLHHVDLIAGKITGPASDPDLMDNPTTRVVAQIPSPDARSEGPDLIFEYKFKNVKEEFYMRVRGTNTNVEAPPMDTLQVDPMLDLWFYSNPIFVRFT